MVEFSIQLYEDDLMGDRVCAGAGRLSVCPELVCAIWEDDDGNLILETQGRKRGPQTQLTTLKKNEDRLPLAVLSL
jgi:hypothetical protein